MKLAVIITCDNNYIPFSIVALKCFAKKNPDYDMFIIGTNFTDSYKQLCLEYNIQWFEINLTKDFINLDKRPYGTQYPIECFYHLYAYKILNDYDYIVQIEPDIYTNKKLDVNFEEIKFIAGAYQENLTINKFQAIMRDIVKIQQAFNVTDISQNKISGGVRIYNVKNLHKINFYEKILEYYLKSIIIDAPRCGDDSLMVLYQIINPDHIYFLSPCHNIIIYKDTNLDNINNMIHFHFVAKKYWQNVPQKGILAQYFCDKMIEFIYNNFSTNYIKSYIPAIYKNIDDTKIIFYYYHFNDNFGDLITPYFLKKFCNNKDYDYDFNNNSVSPKIISCGSIMRLCNKKTIVYGSGIRNIDQDIKPGIIKIVRGPLTRKRLIDIGCYNCPPVYGDPGLLLPLYYKPSIEKKYKLGIIPHNIHYEKIKQQKFNDNILVIDLLNKNIEIVIDQLLSCEKTISSSLHGLIVSDAYGIPNKWIKFDNKITGDDTKFYDYFLSVNRKDRSYVDCLDFKKIPDNIIDLIPDINISYDILKLKEEMFFDETGIKNYTKFLIETISSKSIWYAFKKHWSLVSNNIIISTQSTFLKKSPENSSLLDENMKKSIDSGHILNVIIISEHHNYYLIESIE